MNPSKLTIRKANKNDAQDIIEHILLIADESDFHTFESSEFRISGEDQIRIINTVNASSNSLILLSFIDEALAGVLTLNGGKRSRTEHAAVLGITIKQKYCGNGLGSQMLEWMDNWIRENPVVTKVNLLVHEENFKAIKFYETHGYHYEGQSSGYFKFNGKYFDGIYMGKTFNE